MVRAVKTETVQPAHCCISMNQMGLMKSIDSATRAREGLSIDRFRQVGVILNVKVLFFFCPESRNFQ